VVGDWLVVFFDFGVCFCFVGCFLIVLFIVCKFFVFLFVFVFFFFFFFFLVRAGSN